MSRVKICGLTRYEDAELALQLGAWGLGFIFYAKSPRYVTPEAVREILQRLQAKGLQAERHVGVFVNASAEEIRHVKEVSGIDTIQLHGDEDLTFVKHLSDLRLWKVFRLKTEEQLGEIPPYAPWVEAFLCDAAVTGTYGGTGQLADWGLLARMPTETPLIASGGLHADNIRSAADQLKPFALDVSSGVEEAPGRKDTQKMKALFEALGDMP